MQRWAVDNARRADYIWGMVQTAKHEMNGKGTSPALVVESSSPNLEAHVLKHYPLNKLRPIKIRPASKGKL